MALGKDLVVVLGTRLAAVLEWELRVRWQSAASCKDRTTQWALVPAAQRNSPPRKGSPQRAPPVQLLPRPPTGARVHMVHKTL